MFKTSDNGSIGQTEEKTDRLPQLIKNKKKHKEKVKQTTTLLIKFNFMAYQMPQLLLPFLIVPDS